MQYLEQPKYTCPPLTKTVLPLVKGCAELMVELTFFSTIY
jgi:hypothetical protein